MKYKVKFEYKGAKTKKVSMETEWLDEIYIDNLLEDLQRTGRVLDLLIIDEMEREWNRKEYSKLKIKLELEPVDPIIYFDGGFDIQSGTAGIGIVIYYKKGKEKYRYRANAKLEQLENNNEAEYAALYNALLFLENLGMKSLPVEIKGDSQGVIKQLEGEWPCYEKVLNKWLDRIEAKILDLGLKPNYEIIARRDNKEADKLATQALTNNIIEGHMKIV
ncbi:reverse transcriptase-like protein [Lederbergia wuyishanensis]|uniref:Ribonuclease HI n=1 Tax=Lederbergia wuyishanensis TaxID=1347903 RepID=A0ABU0D0T7_9BACI|nr:reverse transcriptase-like protein [Lederbergia wuyishanensis]MCJ8006617.1 reverse transcriptase-like protein [Lederbergia wuyishanensis]MDQ0341998.1 ribonuclease HI [Lederbergia wuyishanensis]